MLYLFSMRIRMTALITALLMLFFTGLSIASESRADSIVGIWNTAKGEANIQIYKCGAYYCGRIVWTKGKPGTDDKNPDPALRGRSVIGMQMMKNFAFDGKDKWTDGRIYDSDNGKTYSAFITLDSPDKLRLRGYVLFSVLGRSTVWTRTDRKL